MLLELALLVAAGAADEVADERLRAREQGIAKRRGQMMRLDGDAMQLVRELRPRGWRDVFQHVDEQTTSKLPARNGNASPRPRT